MDNEISIGIDLGGTKIMLGAINNNGKVLGTPLKIATNSGDAAQKIVARILHSVEQLLKQLNLTINQIKGIGIGTTGPLDIDKGIILECPQLPTMHYFDLKSAIQNYFGVAVFINNDANCLIYAETVFGSATQKNMVLGFTLGTGIGSAIIINGKIINGARSAAGEVWISPHKEGIIEEYVSGEGVANTYNKIANLTKNPLEIEKLAHQGNKEALQTWNEFGAHLAVPIAWSINLIDPDIVVIGGSISNAYQFFKQSLFNNLEKLVCPVPGKITPVALAELGDYAGFIGAACLVLKNK
ncbi:MAG: ROK family protein [Cyclobacteriaceae bacterium]|nr:ROK family protein [Cyclobacteriaceae bacterium]